MPEYLQTEGSKFTRDKVGIRRFDNVFLIPGPDADGGAEPYAILDTWEPAVKPLGLPFVERQAAKQADGDWLLTISSEGAVDAAALDPQVEIDDSSVESPIETADNFEELAKKYGPILTDDDGQFKGFPRKIKDLAGQQIKNPYFGVSHLVDGNTIVRVTFGLRDFNAELFRGMRKIDPDPLVPTGTGIAIQSLLGEGESFLKKSIKAGYRGNVWLFTMELWKGKWAPDSYTRTE